ncbi:hypothetical protein KKE92_01410 [Candidatus Micrarchaeota archaeon]|nr:hypothetical protein [Candidatus Micrarchaeota archaeon]MBU1681494.1 hypothetical protein [Candidatus Micrarchaeota archaeon]
MCAQEVKEPSKELQREFYTPQERIEIRLTEFLQAVRAAPLRDIKSEANHIAQSMTHLANGLEPGRSEEEDRHIERLRSFADDLRQTAEQTTGLNRGTLETQIIAGHRLLAQFRSWARENRRPGGLMAWPDTGDFMPRVGQRAPISSGLQREF